MKKTIALLLSLITLLLSLSCVFVMPASAAINLWTNLSGDDWYTKQMSSSVSDYTQLVQQKMTEKYPDTFSVNNDVYTLNDAYNKFYYIKMPVLSKNKNYTVSFHYDATLFNSGDTPMLKQVYLIPESALSNQNMFNPNNGGLTGQAYANRGFLGVQEPVYNLVLNEDNASDAFTYTFNTKTHTQYYLYINFGYINQVSFSDFTIIDPSTNTEDNIWKSAVWHSDNESVSFTPVTDSTEDMVLSVSSPWSKNMYTKLPVLSPNTKYEISFKYKGVFGADKSGFIDRMRLASESGFYNPVCWNGGAVLNGNSMAGNRENYGVYTASSSIELTSGEWADFSYQFNTGNVTQYYFYLRTAYTFEFYMTDFKIRQIDVTNPDDVFKSVGASMRREGETTGKPQALRFKFDISRAELEKSYDGYQIAEYGAVVGLENKVGDVLDIGDVTAGNAVKGIAYSKANGTEILYDQTETTNTYTMALYNIGAIKDDSDNITGTNYSKWASVYQARAYAIYKAEGKSDIVLYGTNTLNGYVFGVMNAVLTDATAEQVNIDYVSGLLENAEIKAAYKACFPTEN